MTENITYKRCVCDICKREEHIEQSLALPTLWEHVQFGYGMNHGVNVDLCPTCLKKLEELCQNFKENGFPRDAEHAD